MNNDCEYCGEPCDKPCPSVLVLDCPTCDEPKETAYEREWRVKGHHRIDPRRK